MFSVPSGEAVSLEPFHYAIIGQTQFSGKTTLIKRLADWVVEQDYQVLIFDTKETEADYAGFGSEIPVCLRETTDSFVLIGLLESMFRRKLTPYYATLSRLTEAASGFEEVIVKAKKLEAETKSSWLRDACRVLYDLLERLQNETSKVETVPNLQLQPGISRMVINDFSIEAQQLIVKNAFEDALSVYRRKLVLVVDEAFKFIPQGYSSPATRAIMNVMTQGAKTGLFGWISTQFLAVTDKDPLKACAVKFLGTQDHITEVKHTLDLIPEARGKFSVEEIMKLKLGHWILVRKRPPLVGVVYSLPAGIQEEVGREVALGKRSPESVRDEFLKVKVTEVNDELYKEKCEQLERENQALKTQNEALLQTKPEFEKHEKRLRFLELKNEDLEKRLRRQEEELKLYDELKSVLRRMFPKGIPENPSLKQQSSDVPSEMLVVTQQPTLSIQKKSASLTLDDSSLEGKIAIVYSESKLPSGKWFTTTDVFSALESHAWSRDPRVGPTLDKFCQWGFLEKHYVGRRPEYRLRITVEDAKAKGLFRELEA